MTAKRPLIITVEVSPDEARSALAAKLSACVPGDVVRMREKVRGTWTGREVVGVVEPGGLRALAKVYRD